MSNPDTLVVDGVTTPVVTANLWPKIKAQCLRQNPYLAMDAESGQEVVTCPRCHNTAMSREFIAFSMEPSAIEWSAPVRKCPDCKHIFAFVQ